MTREQPTFTAPGVGVVGCGSGKGDLDKALKMPTIDTVTGNRLSSSTSIQNGTLPKMPGTLGRAGVSHSRTIIESVVTEDTEHTSVFPLEEPKPTSMFPGSTLSSLCYSRGSGIAFRAFLQDVEPKTKSISLSISAWLHPPAHPRKILQAILSR